MKTLRTQLVKIAGWYGMIALLLAFILATFNVIVYGAFVYLFLNITGAAGIAINALSRKDWPAGILNIVWIGIGLVGLAKILH